MFPTGWTKRCAITIPAAQVGTGGVTDFTVLLTEANLPAGLFTDARSDGGDIRFSTDDAGASQLAVDLINYDSGGTALIRVGPVSLSSVSANTLYLWYGAASETLPAAGDPFGQHAAYDSNWEGYWPDGGGNDRTSNGYNGTAGGGVTLGAATGKVGAATDYDGSDDYSRVRTGRIISDLASATVAAWANPDTLTNPSPGVTIYSERGSAGNDIWKLAFDDNADSCEFIHRDSAGVLSRVQFTTPETAGVWAHVGFAKSGTGVTCYRNGASDGTGTLNGSDTLTAASTESRIGGDLGDSSADYNGLISEVQIHSTNRSAAWFATEYNATNDPASFASAGTPEDVSSGLTAGTLSEDSHTHNSATLSWTAASGNSGTVSEQLQRSPAGAGTWANVSGATSSPVTDTGLSAETAYDYRVAYTDDVETVYSNTVEVTTDATPVPDLSVEVEGGDPVTDGGTDALGTVAQGSSQSRSYTITNDGTATATLGTITVGAGLTITADPSGQTIEPEGTKTLTVSVDTSVVAEIDAAISIPSDDADSPYNWNLTASVTDQTAPTKTSMRIVGDQFTFRASESVTGDLTQLAFTASGGALTISSGGTFSGNSAVATLSREPAEDETITATLSEPSGITDAAENEMAGFEDEPVTVGGGGSSGGRAAKRGHYNLLGLLG